MKAGAVDTAAESAGRFVDQFRAFVADESGKYLAIIKETGVAAE